MYAFTRNSPTNFLAPLGLAMTAPENQETGSGYVGAGSQSISVGYGAQKGPTLAEAYVMRQKAMAGMVNEAAEFGALIIDTAKKVIKVGSSIDATYGVGVNVSSNLNFNGDTSLSATYAKGLMLKLGFSLSADVYSSGDISGVFQAFEVCALGCIQIEWNYQNWGVETPLTLLPAGGASLKTGVKGSGREVVDFINGK